MTPSSSANQPHPGGSGDSGSNSWLRRIFNGGFGWPPAVVWIPALLVAAALVLSPAYLALRTVGAGGEAWDVLFRMRVLEILARTVALVFSVTALCVLIAIPLAWLTVRTDLPGRRIWSVAVTLPLVIPSYVAGLIVVAALGPRGMLAQGLESLFGLERLPPIYGFPGALLTLSLLSYPYVLLTVRGSLLRLDPALIESSRGLGRGSWVTFAKVILPLMRPGLMSGALLVALYVLSDFGAVSLLRYETFTWAIFVQYESGLERTLGAALSLVLVFFALGLVWLESIARGRSRYYRSASGSPRPGNIASLGAWRWPALIFCGGVVILSLALPASILVYWAVRGIAAGEPLLLLWSAALNSLYASGLTAVAAVVAALPIAILSVRFPTALSAMLERVTHVGFALPGIAVALALVFFAANYAPALYQTLPLLIFAYAVLFLSPAVGAVRASLLQISPKLEEAARSLGRPPRKVLASVTLPIALPGLVSAGALVFLLTMKELPATLVLGPVGFNTLATSIWGAASEAFFAQAALPALLLIAASFIPMTFLMLREQR